MNKILADGRWAGAHGIGRFTSEVFPRLENITIQKKGPKPLSFFNLIWQPLYLLKNKHKVYFTPGFNALLYSPMPFIFIIHDLNHLHFPDSGKWIKKIYYHSLIKYTARRAYKILTVSEYSKKTILEWTKLTEDKIIVVGSGVSDHFIPDGNRHAPGYPYLLHVGNTKIHKNVIRLIHAFAQADIDSSIKLILTGEKTPAITETIKARALENRVVFSGELSEQSLTDYYRGALALLFPSLYEGFGVPVVESMACGTPVLTSHVTSLPEIAGDAALLVDPHQTNSIIQGITRIVNDQVLRESLIIKGIQRAKQFSWDKTASIVQNVLNEV